jgi:hypothetical protein
MQADDVEQLLRRWGRWFGEAPPAEWDEDSSGTEQGQTHVLLQAMRVDGRVALALDTRLAKLRDRLRRRAASEIRKSGEFSDSREAFAEHLCWGAQSRGGPKPLRMDPTADWVDRLACQLFAHRPVPGVILRIEYCTRGRHRDKLPRAQDILDDPHLKLRHFREELAYARAWMTGAMAGSGAAALRL